MIQSTDSFSIGLSTTGQSINGVRTPSAYFMVDGADNMDNGANGNTVTNPSLDTIAEVKVLTASYSAEFGGRAGALINVVTKGGTREFRGSAYEFIRNQRFDARSFFDRGEPAPLKFNNPGFTIGGPVSFRRFNQDRTKLFFFFSQDWKFNDQGVTNVGTVPTQEERNGDFRNSTLAAPRDPATGTAFRGPDGAVLQVLRQRPGAAHGLSAAELQRAWRQFRRHRHQRDAQPRRGRPDRLRDVAAARR